MTGKFWRLLGPSPRHGAIFRHSVVAQVDGLAGVTEDAIDGDLVADRRVDRDRDARSAVVGDQVARACRSAADRVVI